MAGQRGGAAQRTVAVVAATVIGLAAGYIIVSAQPWAFHYLIHVPTPARWLFAIVVAAVGSGAYWLALRIDRLPPAWDVTRWPAWLMAATGGVVFVLFAERTHYGDGFSS